MKDFKRIIVHVALFFCAHSLSALVDGNLDAAFKSNGLSALLDLNSTIKAVAIQADGKIVAAGFSNAHGKDSFLVARYTIDGSLDKSFGSNGQVITRFGAGESKSYAHALIIQSDGKIVAAGCTNAVKNSLRWCLARYNPDGSLDESFFGGRAIFKGTVITFFANDSVSQANALALAADGRIIAAGMSHAATDKTYFAVARYNTDGSLDEAEFNPEAKGSPAGTVRTTFGGTVNDDQALAVAIQPNGKIVAGGFSMLTGVKTFALARYNLDGSLDTSFFAPGFARYNGTVVTNFACGESEGVIRALVIQADGKIVAAGSTNSNSWRTDVSHFALARYDYRGILDKDFGGYGSATPGTLISSFGQHEGNSRVNALALQGDGKILAAGMVSMNGASHFALARYTSDGNVDCTFNDGVSPAGKVITSLGGRKANEVFALALQNNGNIIAAGSTDMNGRPQGLLARYLSTDVLLEPEIISPGNNSVIVNGSAVQINGTSQNPGILKIFVDENLIGTAVARGIGNTWKYQLPPLASGNHSVKILELYAGGNVSLASQAVNIVIDQHPRPVNATISTCGLNPAKGILEARGASGDYYFAIDSAVNGTVNLDGAEYVFYPSITAGKGSFTFKATDSVTHCSNIGTVNVIINEIPAASSAEFNTCQNTACKGSLEQYISGNAPFSFTQVGASNNGVVTISTNGSFTFNPHDGFNGVTSFQYQVTDAKGCVSEPLTATITVYEAPRAQNSVFTTHEAEMLSNTISNLVSGGTAPYVFNLVNCPGNCAITLQKNGSFVVIPTIGFSGDLVFTYQVTDAHGCMSEIASIAVTVFESPVASNAIMSICQNGQLAQSLNGYVNKGTPAYTYAQIGTAANGIAVLNPDGSFTFTPDTDFVGTASFSYQVVDVNKSMSNSATITITVNELPKVTEATFATCQDTILTASLAATVSGGLAPYTFSMANPATNGLVTINEDGSFEFVPDQGFNGTSDFQYTVTDANGCTSLVAHAPISVWQNPSVQDAVLETCSNRPAPGSLAQLASAGMPPYAFVIDQTENGTASSNDDGSYLFTPAQDFAGTATMVYHAVDAHQCISKAGTITITVHPSPAVVDATASTLENAPTNGTLASLASGGIAPYTFALVGESVNGNATVYTDGSYQFIPAVDYYGDASFNYQIADMHGCVSNVAKVLITVFQLPKVTDYTSVSLANNQVAGTLVDLITVGAAPFIFQIAKNPTHGNVVINADGSYTYTPDADFVGNDTFEYMVTDAHTGTSNVAKVSFNIYKPVEIVQQSGYVACQDSTITGDLSSNVSGSVAPYTFSLLSQPSNAAVILNADGSFTYTPTAGFNGTDSFMYGVVDSVGLSNACAAVQITLYAKPNVQDTMLTTFENQTLTGSLATLASGGNEPYNFVQANSAFNGTVVLNADGTFSFTPISDFVGTASFMYSILDANSCDSNTATITIQVLELPKASNSNVAGVSNIIVSGSLASLVTGGTSAYTFKVVSDPLHGIVLVNADGSYHYAPNSDYVGSDSFQYSVVDANQGTSNTGTISITIYKAVTITNEKQYSSCLNTLISGTVQDVVADGLVPYTLAIAQQPEHGTIQLNADGSFVYTPTTGYSGTDSFQYAVTDALSTTAQGTVSITVFDAPSLQDKTWTIFESEIVQDSVASLIVGGTPPFTVALVGNPTNGTLQLNSDGSFEFAPAGGFIGAANFQYSVTDANGCTGGVATATIQILPLPKAQNGNAIGVTNTPIAGSLAPLASDGTAPYNFQKITDATNGVVVIHNDGSYTYTPNTDYSGGDTFAYEVTDANNGTATALVNIVISKPPVIADGNTYNTCANTAVSGDLLSAVSEGVPPYLFALVTDASNGKVMFSVNGSFAYLPAPGFNGVDSFQFNVTDSIGTIVPATVSITVNQAPIVQDKTWKIQVSELNDSVAPLISGGNPPYKVTQVGHANNGTVILNADGTFTFASSVEGINVGSFAYQVTDANNCISNIGMVTIASNPPPSARVTTFATLQDQPLSNSLVPLMIGGNPPFIFSQVGMPINGSLVLSRNGSFIFTPTPEFIGDASFNFIATDKNGESSALATITITVTQDANKRSRNAQQHMIKRYLNGKNK